MADDILIVSGLPRSGTSLMMQVLDAGGIEVVTDDRRIADTDNPRGYYEFEKVKRIKRDVSWLPGLRGQRNRALLVEVASQFLGGLLRHCRGQLGARNPRIRHPEFV